MGPTLTDSEHARHPQRRGRRAQGHQGAERALAGRLLSRTNTTGATASVRATSRPATLNPNWGGVIEPNTFGTHEFMDFVQQIGADAYLSINVGSGTPAEAADWLEYLTTPQPSALGKQRAANGHPEPYAIPMLGIGNEAWGCGGSMTPDYYVSQLKIYARYARNYNTAAEDAAHRRRPRQRRHRLHQGGDGSLEEQGLGLGHRGHFAALLHGGEVAAGLQGDGLRRGRIRRAAERNAAHE